MIELNKKTNATKCSDHRTIMEWNGISWTNKASSLQLHLQKQRHNLEHLTYLKSLGVPSHMEGQSNAAIIKNQMQNPTFGIKCSRSSCIICDESSRYTVPAPKRVNWMQPDTNMLNVGK
jgi:hypothetical protein